MLDFTMYVTDMFSTIRQTVLIIYCTCKEKKEGDLTQSYDKKPIPTENSKINGQHKKTHQKLRLHNDCGPTQDGQLE